MGWRPNRQTPTASDSLRHQQLHSGEAYIQQHLNSNADMGKRQVGRDRADRATVEQVMDPRTRLILFKLIQRDKPVFESLEGCISTGKEANVYHAVTPTGGSLAVKVYKTSILHFKDRDRYVTGEFRWVRRVFERCWKF